MNPFNPFDSCDTSNRSDKCSVNQPVSPGLTNELNLLSQSLKSVDATTKRSSLLDKTADLVDPLAVASRLGLWSARERARALLSGNLSQQEQQELAEQIKGARQGAQPLIDAHRQIEPYLKEGMKTTALFMRGKMASVATIGTFALDETRSTANGTDQVIDLVLGGLKGAGMKALFSKTAEIDPATCLLQRPAAVPGRAALLGFGARSIDAGLSRSTWWDAEKQQVDLSHGTYVLRSRVVNPAALAVDILSASASTALVTGSNRLTAGGVDRSPLAATVLLGGGYGFSTGGAAELLRQQQAHEKLNPQEIVRKAFVQGAVDSLAALPGGMQAGAAGKQLLRELSIEDRRQVGLASNTREIGPRLVETSQRVGSAQHETAYESHAITQLLKLPGGVGADCIRKGACNALLRSERNIIQLETNQNETVVELEQPHLPLLRIQKWLSIAGDNVLAVKRDLSMTPLPQAAPAELATRIVDMRESTETLLTVEHKQGESYSSYSDYRTRAVKKSPQPVRLYRASGHRTELMVPEEYAKLLDAIRLFRITGAKTEALKQKNDGFCESALPEDFVARLDELPNSTLVKRINIFDQNDPNTEWLRQEKNDPTWSTAASAEPGGITNFYKQSRYGDSLRENMAHEWAHLLHNNLPEALAAYTAAVKLENGLSPKEFNARTYALTNEKENWAVHLGEELMAYEAGRFLRTASYAPIRTAVLARALKWSLNDAPQSEVCRYRVQLENRVKFVEEHVNSSVANDLENQLKKAAEPGIEQLELLSYLGCRLDVGLLKRLATRVTSDRAAELIVEAGARQLSAAPDERLEFLWELANPRCKTSKYALSHFTETELNDFYLGRLFEQTRTGAVIPEWSNRWSQVSIHLYARRLTSIAADDAKSNSGR